MSEQYRCSECGHFVEIQDDAICDVCNLGKMQHLRYIRGGDGSHWEGCEEVHLDCRIAQLEAGLARRDEIIARLKENGERLAARPYPFIDVEHVESGTYCHYCHKSNKFDHTPDCPITLHRALMKELGNLPQPPEEGE